MRSSVRGANNRGRVPQGIVGLGEVSIGDLLFENLLEVRVERQLDDEVHWVGITAQFCDGCVGAIGTSDDQQLAVVIRPLGPGDQTFLVGYRIRGGDEHAELTEVATGLSLDSTR